MTRTTTEMRVWVGCLACYNAGRLVGHWVDADEAGDETSASIHAELIENGLMGYTEHYGPDVAVDRDGPHEELWVFDHEGFGDALTGECSPYEAQRIAEKLAEVPDHIPQAAAAAFLSNHGYSVSEVDWSDLEDSFQGEWDDLGHYAEEFCNDAGYEIKEGWPYSYIDWDRAGRDLELGGDVWTADNPEGGIFVFNSY